MNINIILCHGVLLMENVYYNTKNAAGFGGAAALYSKVKNTYSKQAVKKYVNANPTYRKFKITSNKIKRARMMCTSMSHQFQTDLFDLQVFKFHYCYIHAWIILILIYFIEIQPP